MSRTRVDRERERAEPDRSEPAPASDHPALALGVGNQALARVLDPAQLDRYVKTFKSKGLEHQDADTARNVIGKQLQTDGRPAFDREVEINQILPALGHAVAGPDAEMARISLRETGPIDSLVKAKEAERAHGATGDVLGLINGLDAGNMFSQHDADLARYDPQNPTKDAANYQIQIGGRKLKLGKGKSSVTTVLVSDEIDKIMKASATPADLKTAVVARVRQAHRHSYDSGQVVRLDLRR